MKYLALFFLFLATISFAMPTAFASESSKSMKFFIDTHDRDKGSFPSGKITAADFVKKFAEFDSASIDVGMQAHVAHVNIEEGKAYCFTRATDIETVYRAHAAADLPYDSIIEVRTVTSSDLR